MFPMIYNQIDNWLIEFADKIFSLETDKNFENNLFKSFNLKILNSIKSNSMKSLLSFLFSKKTLSFKMFFQKESLKILKTCSNWMMLHCISWWCSSSVEQMKSGNLIQINLNKLFHFYTNLLLFILIWSASSDLHHLICIIWSASFHHNWMKS